MRFCPQGQDLPEKEKTQDENQIGRRVIPYPGIDPKNHPIPL
jgi:hypothetical protein